MKTQPWYFRVCSWGRGWNLTAACIWYIYNYYNDYHDDKPLDFWWSIFRPGCLASSSRGQEPVLLSLQLRFALPVHEFGHLMTRVAKTWFLWYVFSWIIQIQTTPVLNIAETFKCPLDKLRYSSRGVMVFEDLVLGHTGHANMLHLTYGHWIESRHFSFCQRFVVSR